MYFTALSPDDVVARARLALRHTAFRGISIVPHAADAAGVAVRRVAGQMHRTMSAAGCGGPCPPPSHTRSAAGTSGGALLVVMAATLGGGLVFVAISSRLHRADYDLVLRRFGR